MPSLSEIVNRKVLEHALSLNAAVVLLAHNHPSGLALPSDADKLATKRLKKLFTAVDIELRDHLIFVDEDMVSMRDSGLLDCLWKIPARGGQVFLIHLSVAIEH